MDSSQPDEKSVFHAARRIDSPQARSDYLKQACGGDRGLEDRVALLLRAYDEQTGFLESPPPGLAAGVGGPPVAERPGQTVGRYKLLEEIGEGGMGVVYLAEQQEPVRRMVALKIIKPGMDTRQVVARFEAERQALALMEHPNIARVFDAGTTDSGRPYFVMELVQGIPLTDYCDQNRLTIRERLELFVQVCQAVQHAHTKGIIHRDLKPAHMIVALRDGVPVPKIIDFGIAKATGAPLTEAGTLTGHGQMIGTPLYMSPEQAEMGGTDVDTRSDIYSLGVVLYELLTGSTPLDKERLREAGIDEIRRMIREEDPPRPSTRISALGAAATTVATHRQADPARLSEVLRRDLDWIVMKALEKDRSRRYQTAAELARDNERYLADEPVEARPPTWVDRAAKWARRRRPVVIGALLVLVATTLALAMSTLLIARARNDAQSAAKREGEARIEADHQRDAVFQREATLRRYVYAADVHWAWRAWSLGHLEQARELLLRHQPDADQEDVRSFAWYYLWNLCRSAPTTLRGHTGDVYHVAFSPDGKTLASGGKDRTIVLWDGVTGQQRATLAGHTDDVNYIAFSRDGKFMATADEGYRDPKHPDPKVLLWDPAGGRLLKTLAGFEFPVALALFSPDNKTLIVAEVYWPDGRSRTTLWDVSTGRQQKAIDGRRALALTPDGRTLAVSSPDGKVRLWDLAKHQERAAAAGHDGEVPAGAFSPDGKILATGGRDRRIKLWDPANLEEVATLHGHERCVRSLTFSPDARLLASAGDDARPRLWDVSTRGLLRVLAGHADRVYGLAFSPNGGTLATASSDHTVKLWDVKQLVGRTILPQKGLVRSLTFFPNNRTIATACGDSRGRLWNATTGDSEGSFGVPGRNVLLVAIVPGRPVLAISTDQGSVHLQDLAGQTDAATVAADSGAITSLSFSPDGRLLATETDGRAVRLWETATGKQSFAFHPNDVDGTKGWNNCAFRPDGGRLAVRRTGDVHLLDTANHSLRILTTGHWGYVRCLAYSPDGAVLATGGDDRSVKFFDARTGQERATLLGHRDPVTALAFSPDGKTLASGGENGEVKLWDVFTTQELFPLAGHTGGVWCAAFSADGAHLATGGAGREAGGETNIWHAPETGDSQSTKEGPD